MFDRYNMKKVVLYLVVIIFTSFSIGIVTMYSYNGGKFIVNTNSSTVNSSYSIDESKEESIQSITEISVGAVSAEIIVIPEKRSNVKAHLTGNASNNPRLETSISGNSLKIDIETDMIVGINLTVSKLKLEVYVPEDYSNNLRVKSTSGKIELGNFKLNDVTCGSTSGTIRINKLVTNNFVYTCTSGNFEADTIISKTSSLSSTSGKIQIHEFSGNLKAGMTSGSLDVSYGEFSNNVDIRMVSGDVKLELPQAAEFMINAKTTSGKINCEFPVTVEGNQEKNKLYGYVRNKSNNNIAINTTSGRVDINKK